MTHIENAVVTAQASFGRDGAMFESLLGFVAQLSLMLWGLVFLTVVLRFVGVWIYRRSAARTDLAKTVTASVTRPTSEAETGVIQAIAGTPAVAVTDITSEGPRQSTETPDTVTASARAWRHARRDRYAHVKPAASVPTLATPSTEA